MDNILRNVPQAGTGHNIVPLCKVWQSFGCSTVLEESRTTTVAGNKAISAVPAQDGLAIFIFNSVEGNAWTVPNGIHNKGWLYLGFLTGAKFNISGFVIIWIHFCLYWYYNNDADSLLCINKVSNFGVYQVDILSSRLAMVHQKRVGVLSIKIWCQLPLTVIAGTFSDSWSQKNRWWERILNQKRRVLNWREHILRSEK